MEHYAAELDLEVARWDARGWPRPDVALVAGSGLGVELGSPTHLAQHLTSHWD